MQRGEVVRVTGPPSTLGVWAGVSARGSGTGVDSITLGGTTGGGGMIRGAGAGRTTGGSGLAVGSRVFVVVKMSESC